MVLELDKNVENALGFEALEKFKSYFGVDFCNSGLCDLKRLYKDIINNPIKYKKYISWLLGKFKDFINKHKPLSIYIGNDNFLKRGDQELENYLQKSVKIMSNYIETGKITPNKISTVMYHLNLMSK